MNRHGDTVAALFVSAARAYPGRIFMRWCRGSESLVWSYAEAVQLIAAMVARFDELGIVKGDYAVVYTAEMVPSIMFDLACACAGVVFTPIETNSRPEVLDLCDRTNARVVLTTPDRAGAFAGRPVLAVDWCAKVPGDPVRALDQLSERAAHCGPDDVYMLQPTSGTTGGSKLVIRHHAAFVRMSKLLAFGHERASEPPARVLMVPALTHGMGQYLLSVAMRLAAELCVTTNIDVAVDIEEIRLLDPTHIILTPRVLRSVIQQLGGAIDRIFGPSAKFFVTSGAPPDKELLAAVDRSGVIVVEAYGASEFSAVAMTRLGQWRPEILGHVLDDVSVRVADAGELEVRTPVMMSGYHGAPDLTRAAFTEDGFYRTGDRVTLGSDGELIYHGRTVDSFNLFDGSHVAPDPIENAVDRLPWVAQVVLLGDQRPYLTGLLVAHSSLRSDRSLSLHRLVERDIGRICSTLPPNARVRRLALLDQELPEEVHQIVGHGKVRRTRDVALRLYAEIIQALYGGSTPPGVTLIDVPGAAAERRGGSRQRLTWVACIRGGAKSMIAYTRDVSRVGAFLEHDDPITPGSPMTVEVINLDGQPATFEVELVRHDESGSAVRWTGPAAALARLGRRLPA